MKARILENGGIEVLDTEARIQSIKDAYNAEMTKLKCTDGVMSVIKNKTANDLTPDDDKAVANRKMLDAHYLPQIKEYEEGWKEYVELDYTGKDKPGELDLLMPYFDETKTTVYRKYKVIKNEPEKVKSKISVIKEQLSSTDYKIAKAYEAQLIGEPAPYDDIKDIIAQRKDWRKQINELEKLLES